ncbi:unnamed protein product [Amoebophrya sp. A120]|nr:unnamed protein product [Amoebophrya sp. A120]|eukprot:GSA120T00004027001.1
MTTWSTATPDLKTRRKSDFKWPCQNKNLCGPISRGRASRTWTFYIRSNYRCCFTGLEVHQDGADGSRRRGGTHQDFGDHHQQPRQGESSAGRGMQRPKRFGDAGRCDYCRSWRHGKGRTCGQDARYRGWSQQNEGGARRSIYLRTGRNHVGGEGRLLRQAEKRNGAFEEVERAGSEAPGASQSSHAVGQHGYVAFLPRACLEGSGV